METPSKDYIEQKITQQVTIVAGATGKVEVPIPKDKSVFLKGYGYTWFTSCNYTLSNGAITWPSRSDQEGSPAIPVIFGTPFKSRSGGSLKLNIINGDSSDHTFDVVFYIITNDLLDVASTGGDLNLSIGGSTGVASAVSITDSTGSTSADVTSRGLETYNHAPGTLLSGSVSAGTGATQLASSASCEEIIVSVTTGSSNSAFVGNAGSQLVEIPIGGNIAIKIDDISKIYVKQNGGAVTVNYVGA